MAQQENASAAAKPGAAEPATPTKLTFEQRYRIPEGFRVVSKSDVTTVVIGAEAMRINRGDQSS